MAGVQRFVVTYSEPSQYHKKAKNRKQLDGYVLVSADGKSCLYNDSDMMLMETVGVHVSEGQEYESENYVVFVDHADSALDEGAPASMPGAVASKPAITLKRRRLGLGRGKSLQLRPASSSGGVNGAGAGSRPPGVGYRPPARDVAQRQQPEQPRQQPHPTMQPQLGLADLASRNFTLVRVPSGGRKACEIVHFLASRFEDLKVPPELAHAHVRSEEVVLPTQIEQSSPPSQSLSSPCLTSSANLNEHQIRTVASIKSSGLSETNRNLVEDRRSAPTLKAFKRLSSSAVVRRPLIHTNSGATATRDGAGHRNDRPKLCFLEGMTCAEASPKRTVVIPDIFESTTQYQHAWTSALYEEINLMLHESACSFFSAAKVFAPAHCGGQNAAVLQLLARADEAVAKRVQVHARKRRVGLYTQATVRKHTRNQERWRKKRSATTDEDEGEDTVEPKFFLKLQDRESYKEYSKDMLFIIASNLSFTTTSRLDFVGYARSHWHGPSSTDGSLEVGWIGSVPHLAANKEVKVFVLRGPQMNSELAMLDAIESVGSAAVSDGRVVAGQALPLPLLPAILHPRACTAQAPSIPEGDAINLAVAQHVEKSNLNAEQASVLQAAAGWFAPRDCSSVSTETDNDQSGILLVHGVFGAGKSMTLRALTKLLVELSSMKDVRFRRLTSSHLSKSQKAQRPRVIVVGYTNMSVDNVLTGLLEDGFKNFVRVGSLRAMDKTLLPFSVSGGKVGKDADADTMKELTAMLTENLSAAERSAVEQTLAELRADTGSRVRSHSVSLKDVDVIGVTCLSANAAALDSICADQRPSILLMDEASQMLEPMSLVALGRFCAARLLAVGDPKQLPPPLHGASNGVDDRATSVGLGKTLFTRLAPSTPLVMLRTQYRCHPHIANIVNGLFYDGQLRSAANLECRQPVLSALKPVSFATTAGCARDCPERQLQSGSFVNDGEAQHCVHLVRELTQFYGVTANQIGVIALYKAQAHLLRSRIDEECGVDDGAILVSTVDAFQGGERDIILISCARTSTVGFTDNAERLNVALTRARHHLIIIGNAVALQVSKTWAAVIQHKDVCRGTIDCLHEHLRNSRCGARQSGHDQAHDGEDEADMEAWAAEVAAAEKVLEDTSSSDPSVTTQPHIGEQDEAGVEAWTTKVTGAETQAEATLSENPSAICVGHVGGLW